MASISRIVIDQQYAEIGVKVTRAQMNIETPHPQMEVKSELPEMTIERQEPEFELNWRKVRSESGLKPPLELATTTRDRAKSGVMKNIADIAQEGDFYAKVEQPGNRIAEFSRKKSLTADLKDINLGLVPQSLPEVTWDPGYIHINWSNHQFEIDWVGDYMPEIVIDPPYSVEIFLRNKPYIKITVEEVEAAYDVGAGMRVDTVF